MAPHRPSHWILIALVVLAAMFTLREVHGKSVAGEQAAAPAPGAIDSSAITSGALGTAARPRGDKRSRDTDPGMARDKGSTTKNAARTVRRQLERVRHAITSIDAK